MNIREVAKQGKSQAKHHTKKMTLRGMEVDCHFVSPNAKEMDFMRTAVYMVERKEPDPGFPDDRTKDKSVFVIDPNQSDMATYNAALLAFTLRNDDGKRTFDGAEISMRVQDAGDFLYALDENEEPVFTNEEVAALITEAQQVFEVKTVEEHEKN